MMQRREQGLNQFGNRRNRFLFVRQMARDDLATICLPNFPLFLGGQVPHLTQYECDRDRQTNRQTTQSTIGNRLRCKSASAKQSRTLF